MGIYGSGIMEDGRRIMEDGDCVKRPALDWLNNLEYVIIKCYENC